MVKVGGWREVPLLSCRESELSIGPEICGAGKSYCIGYNKHSGDAFTHTYTHTHTHTYTHMHYTNTHNSSYQHTNPLETKSQSYEHKNIPQYTHTHIYIL